MRHFGLGIMFICLVWGPSMECSAQQGNTSSGNRALMEEWQSRQNAVKQELYNKLKKEGRLPRNGRVEFEARVKTDPKNKKKVQLEIDNIRIIDESQGKSGSVEVPARGKGSGKEADAVGSTLRMPGVELRNIELKGGEFLRDHIEIRDIEIPGGPAIAKGNVSKPAEESKAPEAAPQVEKPTPPAEPEQKSWWKRLFGL
jgi:hypothetical protein